MLAWRSPGQIRELTACTASGSIRGRVATTLRVIRGAKDLCFSALSRRIASADGRRSRSRSRLRLCVLEAALNTIPFVDLKAQYHALKHEITPAIEQVLEAANYILGPNVDAFEREFADFVGSSHAVACANGSDALEMVFRAWGIGPDDEVIVPANTWITSVSSATMYGARPVFADTHPDTFTIDPADIERKITARTKAIVAVHLYGMPADMDAIMQIAQSRNIRVLEDCAQSHGARHHGRHVGTIGEASTWSFYPGKNLGAYGDAGAIIVNDAAEAELLHRIGNHGQLVKHDHRMEGRNSRLDEIQAAILRVKLRRLGDWVEARRRHAKRYMEQLAGLPLTLPVIPTFAEPSWHIFAIRVKDRDGLRAALASEQIETNVHYPVALPFVPAYAYLNPSPDDFPVAREQTANVVALPMYAELTNEQIDRVCAAVRRFLTA